MILGDGVTLQYIGSMITADTFDENPRGLHTAVQPVLEAQRCCEFDHILACLRALPLAIARRPPFTGEVRFKLLMLRWEYMGHNAASMETCIRLIPFGLPAHFTVSTEPGQQFAGVIDRLDCQGFVCEPEFTYLRLEVCYNKFATDADEPLGLRHEHAVRWYNGQPCRTPDSYACAV